MSDRILIYGAAGYTGRLIVREALARGLRPILGGRDQTKLQALARADQLRYRVAALQEPAALEALLRDVDVVLNAAGPFHATALPLARACIARAVHYLDISGELSVFEALAALGAAARRNGVMLLPGVGFDVVVSDCAAAQLARQLPSATQLAFGLTGLRAISRGSAATVVDHFSEPVSVRRDGKLVQAGTGELTRDFDFGEGPRRATAIGWADLTAAYHSTRIPNITFYYDVTPLVQLGVNLKRDAGWLLETPGFRLLQGTLLRIMPDGPPASYREQAGATCVVEVSDDEGRCQRLRVHAPEVYSFTAVSAAAIADRVLCGEHKPGFQTPSSAFGPEVGLTLPGVRVEAASTSNGATPSR